MLDVQVSAEQVDRAMCVMDALLKALDVRGFAVESRPLRPVRRPSGGGMMSWSGDGDQSAPKACAKVDDQDVLLVLREHRKRVDRRTAKNTGSRGSAAVFHDPYPRYDFIGSGLLVLSIPNHVGNWGAVTTWAESPRRRIEDMLNEVVVGVVVAAQEFRETQARWADQELEREERARRARVEQQQREIEAARVRQLEEQASNWARARQLRDFITAVRAAGDDIPATFVASGMTRDEWLAWVDRYVSALDHLPTANDEQRPRKLDLQGRNM